MVFINYVDRTSLSYAFLKPSFRDRLGITESTFGLGSGLFYVTYILFQMP